MLTYSASAGWLSTSNGSTAAIPALTSITNSVGTIEGAWGGFPSFDPTGNYNYKPGFNIATGVYDYFNSAFQKNLAKQVAWAPGTGCTITYSPTDVTCPASWTAGKQIGGGFWEGSLSNGIEVASGQVGFPTPQGQYTIVWDDANAGTGNEMQAWITASSTTTLAGTYDTTSRVNGVRTRSGNTITITYPNIQYASTPNLTHGYNMALAVQLLADRHRIRRVDDHELLAVRAVGHRPGPLQSIRGQ